MILVCISHAPYYYLIETRELWIKRSIHIFRVITSTGIRIKYCYKFSFVFHTKWFWSNTQTQSFKMMQLTQLYYSLCKVYLQKKKKTVAIFLYLIVKNSDIWIKLEKFSSFVRGILQLSLYWEKIFILTNEVRSYIFGYICLHPHDISKLWHFLKGPRDNFEVDP